MVRLPAADASKFPAQNYGTDRQRGRGGEREGKRDRHTLAHSQAHRQTLASRVTAFESKIIHIRKMFEPSRHSKLDPGLGPDPDPVPVAVAALARCQINDDI